MPTGAQNAFGPVLTAVCLLSPKAPSGKNEQLKRERDEALAKSYKASVEIQSIESQLGKMVKQELENIAVQEEEERAEASSKALSDCCGF